MTREGFWHRPSAWVSSLLLLSLGLLSASLLTLREDMRFQSRALRPNEKRIVEQARAIWVQSGVESEVAASLDLDNVRAMDDDSFARPQERGTYGYTDKRRRILLNPELCFTVFQILGPGRDGRVDEADLAPTLATLYHETQHLLYGVSEEEAYLREWRFVRAVQRARSNDPARARLKRELERWEDEIPGRIEEKLGPALVPRLRARL